METPSWFDRVRAVEKRLHTRYMVMPDSPENRRKVEFYNTWIDHGFLRHRWTNEFEIAPGVWRSNHPTPERFRAIADRGIKAIINLRGDKPMPFYYIEQELCEELGLALHSVSLAARSAPSAPSILTLLEYFRTVPRPFLMHCKSGADRAGLASAIYMMEHEGQTPEQALEMLSFKYLHRKSTRTGVLDRFMLTYIAHNRVQPIGFEDWVRDHYNAKAVKADFLAHGLFRIPEPTPGEAP